MKPRNLKKRSFFYTQPTWFYACIYLGLGLLSGIGIGSFFFAGDIYNDQAPLQIKSTDSLPHIDAIICLAGGRGRVTAAGDLWLKYWNQLYNQKEEQEGELPILYFSGIGKQTAWVEISQQLKREVLQTIRPENIIMEKESTNTEANARWVQFYAQKLGWKKILLVTSSYHMKRARMIFTQVLSSSPTPLQVYSWTYTQEPFDSKEWWNDFYGIRITIQEYWKWLYYRFIAPVDKHSKDLGLQITKIRSS